MPCNKGQILYDAKKEFLGNFFILMFWVIYLNFVSVYIGINTVEVSADNKDFIGNMLFWCVKQMVSWWKKDMFPVNPNIPRK